MRTQRLETRIPPPLVMLAAAGITGLLAWLFPGASFIGEGSTAAAGALALIGVGVGAAGAIAFRRARTTLDPHRPDQATTLVTTGVYRVSRNPMYLGLLLVLLAWAFYLDSWPGLLVGPTAFVVWITRFQIVPEERFLMQLFGPDYIAYLRRTGRWLL